MKFLLVLKGEPEMVQLYDVPRIVTDTTQLNIKRKHWTYVNKLQNATLFDSEHLAELGRDFCRLPWIKIRPATEEEINDHSKRN